MDYIFNSENESEHDKKRKHEYYTADVFDLATKGSEEEPIMNKKLAVRQKPRSPSPEVSVLKVLSRFPPMRTPSPMGDMDIKKYNARMEKKENEKKAARESWTKGIEILQVPHPSSTNKKYAYERTYLCDTGYDSSEEGLIVHEIQFKNKDGRSVRDLITVTTRDKQNMKQQQLDFPSDPPPPGMMYHVVGATPMCFSNYYPTICEMHNLKNHSACFGCKKSQDECDELLFGRYCLQACYVYFYKRYGKTTQKDMDDCYFKAYNCIRQTRTWARSDPKYRFYDTKLTYLPPTCMVCASYMRACKLLLSLRTFSKFEVKDIVCNACKRTEDAESIVFKKL